MPLKIASGAMNPTDDGSGAEVPAWNWLVWFDTAAHAEMSGE